MALADLLCTAEAEPRAARTRTTGDAGCRLGPTPPVGSWSIQRGYVQVPSAPQTPEQHWLLSPHLRPVVAQQAGWP